MTEYFAVLGDHDRRGPFNTMKQPVELLKQTAKRRGYSDEQAQHFFLHESAVEQVDTVNGNTECFRLGWLAREQSGIFEQVPTKNSVEPTQAESMTNHVANRLNEDEIAESNFTLTSRKAAEVSEGGLIDPKVP